MTLFDRKLLRDDEVPDINGNFKRKTKKKKPQQWIVSENTPGEPLCRHDWMKLKGRRFCIHCHRRERINR